MHFQKCERMSSEELTELQRLMMERNETTQTSYLHSTSTPAHDEFVASLLLRILSSPVIDDPFYESKKDNQPAPLYLKVDICVDEIRRLCEMAKAVLLQDDTLIELGDRSLPVTVCSDLHGQILHLMRILRYVGLPTRHTFVFLGDYVDRGVQGIELVTLLFCLKLRYPTMVYLLRGNHEDCNISLNYGFYDECVQRFPLINTDGRPQGYFVWRCFLEAFGCLPLAALICSRIFAAHGGISPYIERFEDINMITRPTVVPPFGLATDLLWADPVPKKSGIKTWALSHRGISFLFGSQALEDFCEKLSIDVVLRGHQIWRELYNSGYIVNDSGRMSTIFSSLNYTNVKNSSGVGRIELEPNTGRLVVSFIVFRCYNGLSPSSFGSVEEDEETAPNTE